MATAATAVAEKAIAATSPGSRSVRYTTRLQLYAAHVPTRYRMHGCRSIQPCTIYIIYIPRKSPVRASQYSTYELAGVTCVSFLSMRSTSRGRHLSTQQHLSSTCSRPHHDPKPVSLRQVWTCHRECWGSCEACRALWQAWPNEGREACASQ